MAESLNTTGGLLAIVDRVPGMRQVLLLVALAVSISIGVTAAFWLREPAYASLYRGMTDKDAAEIVDALRVAQIPVRVDSATGSVEVAGDSIHEARLELAAQGLPRGAGFGIEIIQKESGISSSQFIENARYHHALETELSRTISSLRPVQSARVHLAIPSSTVFLRRARRPSASVLLSLFPGRVMESAQINSVVNLVASSIPELETGRVTVVDQYGRLLSSSSDGSSDGKRDESQFDYVERVENSYVTRIESLLEPMLGPGRVRVSVAAQVDFTEREETREVYDPDAVALRSEQFASNTGAVPPPVGGVPGALSNVAPVSPQAAPQVAGQPEEAPQSVERTRNFEVDRTISHTRRPVGSIGRLSVAVLVDDRGSSAGAEGADGQREPLEQEEIDKLTQLVRDAVGYDEARGDSVTVRNVSFFEPPEVPEVDPPGMFESPLLRDLMRQAAGLLAILAIGFGVVRPLLKNLAVGATRAPALPAPAATGGAVIGSSTGEPAPAASLSYDDKVDVARQLAGNNPERVAEIVKTWVNVDD